MFQVLYKYRENISFCSIMDTFVAQNNQIVIPLGEGGSTNIFDLGAPRCNFGENSHISPWYGRTSIYRMQSKNPKVFLIDKVTQLNYFTTPQN